MNNRPYLKEESMGKLTTILLIAVFTIPVLTAFAETVGAGEEPELIPLDVLFGNPTKHRARISPDGTMLAYLAPYEDVVNVWVKTIGKEDDRPVTMDTERPIYIYTWAQDNEHVLYLRDKYGDENDHLYRVDLDSGETEDLTPFDGVKVELYEHNKHFPNRAIVTMNRRNPELFDVYALDLGTGEVEMMAENPGDVIGWDLDAGQVVRGANVMAPDGSYVLRVRDDAESDWRELIVWDVEDAMNSTSLDFDGSGDWMYLFDSRDANTTRLAKINVHTDEIEVIAEDPVYDVSGFMLNPDTFELEAYAVYGDREEWVALDENVREDFERIGEIDDGDFRVLDRDNADDTWIVYFDKTDESASYYAYDRNTKEATFLFYTRPELNDYTLATMEPIEFTARDGLTVHGYATFPPGKGREDLSTVLFVHGGPWDRDRWWFDPFVQALANRGYLVLQVNYRGSAGYGKGFINAGNKEWGGKMQDDLTDAVGWAVERGWADPDKVAIMGFSYGGYTALIGATFTPDLYTCAVSSMGPSNLVTFIETIPAYWAPVIPVYNERIGNVETERELLESRSPIFKVDEIKIPMLLSYGANDPRVKLSEGEQIVAVMEEKGIDYEFIVFDDEGHGFQQPHNMIKFMAAVEEFLAEHLGGRWLEYEE
jgi:dipeptidyl aminopeptidase/acylaminoacyl peptidase